MIGEIQTENIEEGEAFYLDNGAEQHYEPNITISGGGQILGATGRTNALSS